MTPCSQATGARQTVQPAEMISILLCTGIMYAQAKIGVAKHADYSVAQNL